MNYRAGNKGVEPGEERMGQKKNGWEDVIELK